jgi:hypothetical protein
VAKKEVNKYLVFVGLDYLNGKSLKKKTSTIGVFHRGTVERLGIIEWYSPWRQYIFSPDDDTLYSAECLQDISNFISKMMSER